LCISSPFNRCHICMNYLGVQCCFNICIYCVMVKSR
jgi:hypothetical protein